MKGLTLCKIFPGLAVLLSLTVNLHAQECARLVPLTVGSQMEMKHYDTKSKVVSTTTSTVKSMTNTAKGYEVKLSVKSASSDGKKEQDQTLTFRCENGNLIWDMDEFARGLMPGEGMSGFEMKVSSTPLKYPSTLFIGKKLDDASITASFQKNKRNMFDITSNFINRKVEAYEQITTPAGTFTCYKISYDIESKAMQTFKIHQVEWMSEGVGMVRTESYDQAKKLTSYSVLTNFIRK
jgi:hypothetical protein